MATWGAAVKRTMLTAAANPALKMNLWMYPASPGMTYMQKLKKIP